MAEAEAVLVAALNAGGPSARYVTELPANLADVVPLVRIGVIDADEELVVFEEAICDFECFAATRGQARALAYAVRDYIRQQLPGTIVGSDAFVTRTKTANGPRWLPYDNTAVRRFIYTAQVRIHSI